MDTIIYRRTELYEQVWKEPVRTVARAYGISDVWLAKICRKLSVPRPPRGYWIRKRSGWGDKQPPLTPVPEGKPVEITVPRRRQMVFLSRLLRPEEGEQAPRPKSPVIEVPERLDRPHKLVVEAAKLLRGRDSSDGYVSCWSVSCLSIRVTKPLLGRVLTHHGRTLESARRPRLSGRGHIGAEPRRSRSGSIHRGNQRAMRGSVSGPRRVRAGRGFQPNIRLLTERRMSLPRQISHATAANSPGVRSGA